MRRALFVVLLTACGPKGPTDAEQQERIVNGMHDALLTEIRTLKSAAQELKMRAHVPSQRGWDATLDAAEIAAMKESWAKARTAYEHIEGAIAPLFPDLDEALDQRYDGFLEGLPNGDADLFDGEGVVGMHAVERILWADAIPQGVIDIEAPLPGYQAAAFPATEAQARDFKEKLVTQLIADVQKLESQWSPAKIDLAGAYQGLVDLMREQREKVNNASNNLEESRYAQCTMRDLRDNLAGTKTIYALFQPWLKAKTEGETVDVQISMGFGTVEAAYAEVQGDAIPAPPMTWSAEMPTDADLQTPFGRLYTKVRAATDTAAPTSVVKQLGDAGKLMGF